MINKNKLQNEERRRYFRINDDINLFYKVITDHSLIKTSHLNSDILSNCSLSTALDLMTQEAKLTLHRIDQNEPEIAKYLAMLNSKIDLLAQALKSLGADSTEYQTRTVSLSASGVAFDCEEALNIGDMLEIKMVLSSLTAVIVTYAKVVYCKINPENNADRLPYVIGVDYVNLQEQEQELMIKHMIKKQMQQIRKKKDSG